MYATIKKIIIPIHWKHITPKIRFRYSSRYAQKNIHTKNTNITEKEKKVTT
jgi:hypothetical protein